MKVAPFTLVNSAALTSGYTSSAMDMSQVILMTVQSTYSGPLLGELSLQVSNDVVPIYTQIDAPYFQPTIWTKYSGTVSSTVAAAGSTTLLWNLTDIGFRWARVSFIASSGSGTLEKVNVLTKGW